MHPIEIEECLKSMEVLIDTREQPSAKATKRFNSLGCPFHRHKLNYGDYTYNFTLPNGEKVYNDSDPVDGMVVIERKMSLTELSNNFCQERERFIREFERAMDAGARVYMLVEDATFEALYNGKYKTKFHPNAFTSSLWAFCARYNMTPIFCKSETSGKIIHDILYRELKERLERGYYG